MADQVFSVDALAEVFRCHDTSYSAVLSAYRVRCGNGWIHGAPDGVPCKRVRDQFGEELHYLFHKLEHATWMVNEVLSNPLSDRTPVLEEFCHRHLPAFVSAFRAAGRFSLRSSLTRVAGPDHHVWTILWAICRSASMSRYLREHKGGRTFLLDAMTYLRAIMNAATTRLLQEPDWCFDSPVLEALNAVKILSLAVAPSSQTYAHEVRSHIAHEILVGLVPLEDAIKDALASHGQPDRFKYVQKEMYALGMCFNERLDQDCCEIEHCTACVQVTGEMKACGGCRAVRYCSPAHQKAHWKTHKPTCKEPIW